VIQWGPRSLDYETLTVFSTKYTIIVETVENSTIFNLTFLLIPTYLTEDTFQTS